MSMNKNIWSLVIIAVICAVGCSKNVKVSGKVTYPDGSPVTVGRVTFETPTFSVSGALKEDGTYTLGTLSEGDGITPGQYKVFIAGAMHRVEGANMIVPSGAAEGQAMPMFVPAVAPKFTKADTSGITCEVKGSMTFNFEVAPPVIPGSGSGFLSP